jgi:hypothetical protein
MLILLIVLLAVVALALALTFGRGFGGGYGGPDGPVVHRRIIYRRPARRVVTERRIVDDTGQDPVDGPAYRP